MVEILVARPEDAEAMSALAAEVQALHAGARPDVFKAPGPETLPPTTIRDRMATAGHLFWVAVVDGGVAGYAYVTVQQEPETSWKYAATVATLDQMGVAARSRRRGAGTALVAAARRSARAHGAHELRLNVWAFNAEARDFYARCGFAIVQERRWLPTANGAGGDPPPVT